MSRHSAPRPTRSFYGSHPRAALLRSTGLANAEAFQSLIEGDEEATGRLLDTTRQLRALGIVANMHLIKGEGWLARWRQRRLMTNPVRLAEFACGQLLNAAERTNLAAPNPAAFEEHDLLDGEGRGSAGDGGDTVVISEAAAIPPTHEDFALSQHVTSYVIHLLDGTPSARDQ